MTIGSGRHASLPFGAFYGRLEVRHSAPGLDIAVLDADPHRVVERHSHEEAHFVLVLEGLYVSSAAGADPISRGRALIFNPAGTTHRDRFEARSPVIAGSFLTVSIGADVMDLSRREGRVQETASAVLDVRTIALAERLAHACHAHSTDATLRRESLALSLLSAVTPAWAADTVLPSPPRWLAIAREQLDDRCHEVVRIAEIAQASGVHPVHLARVFRRYLGCSPGDYLRQRRLARTSTLLRETERSLSDIASSSGYVDQSHFAKAFKSDAGITPRAYRQSVRAQLASQEGHAILMNSTAQ